MAGIKPTIWLFKNHLDLSPFYLNSRLQDMQRIVSYKHDTNKERKKKWRVNDETKK